MTLYKIDNYLFYYGTPIWFREHYSDVDQMKFDGLNIFRDGVWMARRYNHIEMSMWMNFYFERPYHGKVPKIIQDYISSNRWILDMNNEEAQKI